jgi:hypothetical protein
MDATAPIIVRRDVTLAYAPLDLSRVDANGLRSLAGLQATRVLVAPERIVAVYPSASVVVEIDGKRIRATQQQRSQDLAAATLCQMVSQCHKLAGAPALTAYGFNYAVELTLTTSDLSANMAALLTPDAKKTEALVGGSLIQMSFTPQIIFRRDQTLYELSLLPPEGKLLRTTLTAHFEREGIKLPSADQLEASCRKEYEGYTALLDRLSGGKK